jgi:hypothetical protein
VRMARTDHLGIELVGVGGYMGMTVGSRIATISDLSVKTQETFPGYCALCWALKGLPGRCSNGRSTSLHQGKPITADCKGLPY